MKLSLGGAGGSSFSCAGFLDPVETLSDAVKEAVLGEGFLEEVRLAGRSR